MRWLKRQLLLRSFEHKCIFLPEAVDCGRLDTPQNGTMVGEGTTYPNTVQFRCDEGFILDGSWLRKCQTNGTWSGNTTKCQGITTFNTALHICQVISISLTRIGQQRPLELSHPSRSMQHLGWRLHYGTKTSHYLHSKEHFSFS